MSECLFCRIAGGEAPAHIIYEDEQAVAFLDIAPWQDGHALVIPRRHVDNVLEEDTVLADLSEATTAVARMVMNALNATGCNLVVNSGADAGQEVFHAHVHVVPRYHHAPGLQRLRSETTADPAEIKARIDVVNAM